MRSRLDSGGVFAVIGLLVLFAALVSKSAAPSPTTAPKPANLSGRVVSDLRTLPGTRPSHELLDRQEVVVGGAVYPIRGNGVDERSSSP